MPGPSLTVPPCAELTTTTLKIRIDADDLDAALALLTKIRRSVRNGCPFGQVSADASHASFSVEIG